MKKVMFIACLFLVTYSGKLFAQDRAQAVTEISSLKLTDGKNTVPVPNDKGSLQFVKRGDGFSDVVYVDGAGKTTRLVAKPASTNGAIPSPCKFPIPDACFGLPNSQEIAMCFCKSTNISSEEYTVTLRRAILTVRKASGKELPH